MKMVKKIIEITVFKSTGSNFILSPRIYGSNTYYEKIGEKSDSDSNFGRLFGKVIPKSNRVGIIMWS